MSLLVNELKVVRNILKKRKISFEEKKGKTYFDDVIVLEKDGSKVELVFKKNDLIDYEIRPAIAG